MVAYIKPYRIYAEKRLKTNAISAINRWNESIAAEKRIDIKRVCAQQQSYTYNAILKHTRSVRLQQKLIGMSHPIIQQYALTA